MDQNTKQRALEVQNITLQLENNAHPQQNNTGIGVTQVSLHLFTETQRSAHVDTFNGTKVETNKN